MTAKYEQQTGAFTRAEIYSQPEVWGSALQTMQRQSGDVRRFIQNGNFEAVMFTGCGSTYYLALAAAAVFQSQTGIPARGLPASEIWLDAGTAYTPHKRHLLIAVSRSGSTTETMRAVDAFHHRGHGSVMTLSCYPAAPLAGMGEMNLLFPEAQEESVAQTRAFSTLYLASAALGYCATGDEVGLAGMGRLPEAGKNLLERYAEDGMRLGGDLRFERTYFLGSGARYGLACEVSLKMKEMSLSHSEPFHFMEFRHGPMSMVNEQTLLVGLVSEGRREHEMRVLSEMKKRGATVLTLGEQKADVSFNSGVQEDGRGALYLPILQLLAYQRSIQKGLNPDRPHNLTAVIELGE